MASTQDSSHIRDSPVDKLNNAMSNLAASFIKKELLQLTRECNEDLNRLHVPQLHALLVEVDKRRQSFEDAKNTMLQDLKVKLEAFNVDSGVIDSVITDLQNMRPAYLNVIPSASSLDDRLLTPTDSPSSGSQLTSLAESVGESVEIGIDLDGPPSLPDLDGEEYSDLSNHAYPAAEMRRSSQTRRYIVDHALQEQLAAETSDRRSGLKRSRSDAFGLETDEAASSNVRRGF